MLYLTSKGISQKYNLTFVKSDFNRLKTGLQ